MGLYDNVVTEDGHIMQTKHMINPYLDTYKIGDVMDTEDGIYVLPEGGFVVKDRHVLYATTKVWNKYGEELTDA